MSQSNKKIEPDNLPVHIGFIMDNNRHWARENNKPYIEAYRRGGDVIMEMLEASIELGIKYVTVYAFSTENWRRPEDQKKVLMKLFMETFKGKVPFFVKNGIKVNFVGRLEDFSKEVQDAFRKTEQATKGGKSLTFNVAVSYGGRAEIVDAAKKIIADGLSPDEVTEEKFSEYIYEAGQPDPDLIVRTSKEQRTSGFMLWQSHYSEFYFADVYWPDFNRAELAKALEFYKNSIRNFGK